MYSPTDRVITSLMFACRQWERLLRHKPFVVNHDIKTWLRVVERPTPLGCKWLKELSAFTFEFSWTSGDDETTETATPAQVLEAGESNCMEAATPREGCTDGVGPTEGEP